MRFMPLLLAAVFLTAPAFAGPPSSLEARAQAKTTAKITAFVDRLSATNAVPAITRLPRAQRNEVLCLAATLWHEARSSSRNDRLSIARVVFNRQSDGRHPDSLCGVIGEMREHKNKIRAQFSWVTQISDWTPDDNLLWTAIQMDAYHVWKQPGLTDFAGCVKYYYNPDLVDTPNWTRSLVLVARIGAHNFYCEDPRAFGLLD